MLHHSVIVCCDIFLSVTRVSLWQNTGIDANIQDNQGRTAFLLFQIGEEALSKQDDDSDSDDDDDDDDEEEEVCLVCTFVDVSQDVIVYYTHKWQQLMRVPLLISAQLRSVEAESYLKAAFMILVDTLENVKENRSRVETTFIIVLISLRR